MIKVVEASSVALFKNLSGTMEEYPKVPTLTNKIWGGGHMHKILHGCYCMGQSPSWAANRFSASQEI